MLKNNSKIIISRTDSIGDVVLTLPLCGYIKKNWPTVKIYFLASSYTIPVLECCEHIDEIINWDELKKNNSGLEKYKADVLVHIFPNRQIAKLAQKAGIPIRIGTSHRMFHLFTCNKLVNFTRKNSDLHEGQLNFKLLNPLGITHIPALKELESYYGFTKIKPLNSILTQEYIDPTKCNLIIHPKSKGSAREWPVDNYIALISLLPKDQFNIIVSGTPSDSPALKDIISLPDVKNAVGKFALTEFISLINESDSLLACSTGPLHIAAALNKFALGIYPPMKPIHPGRWAPVGPNANYLVTDKNCSACRKSLKCACINEITPLQVLSDLLLMAKK